MEEIIKLIRKKSQLLYDINCVKKYIDDLEYDNNLKTAWDQFNDELVEVSRKLEVLRKPQIEEFEQKKMNLLSRIKEYENQLSTYKHELAELDNMITNINK